MKCDFPRYVMEDNDGEEKGVKEVKSVNRKIHSECVLRW